MKGWFLLSPYPGYLFNDLKMSGFRSDVLSLPSTPVLSTGAIIFSLAVTSIKLELTFSSRLCFYFSPYLLDHISNIKKLLVGNPV